MLSEEQLSTQNNKLGRAVQENFPELRIKGQARENLAARVGLGSGRNYEKATKVVDLIDSESDSGNRESAQGLRKILNEQSVDAAFQLLKYDDDKRSQPDIGFLARLSCRLQSFDFLVRLSHPKAFASQFRLQSRMGQVISPYHN